MPADQVDQAEVVEPKARNVAVVDEVLPLELKLVVLQPIAPYRKHGRRAFLHGDHVWQLDAVRILVSRQVHIDVHLHQLEPLVGGCVEALLLGFLLLHIVHDLLRLAEVHITVEPRHLKLAQLVLRLPHAVRNPLRRLYVGRTVRHDDVFSGNKHRRLTPVGRIKVNLLEGIA